jgi:hypothetical protein
MECDVFYGNHPPYEGDGDRCARNEIAAGTAVQFSILGASTTFCGEKMDLEKLKDTLADFWPAQEPGISLYRAGKSSAGALGPPLFSRLLSLLSV